MAELPGLRALARDFQGRQDLRCTRVFSIDPPSARDLDDALSVMAHADGTFDVGVHIADVSHFVRRACGRRHSSSLFTLLCSFSCEVWSRARAESEAEQVAAGTMASTAAQTVHPACGSIAGYHSGMTGLQSSVNNCLQLPISTRVHGRTPS
jgi:hypothetical protein